MNTVMNNEANTNKNTPSLTWDGDSIPDGCEPEPYDYETDDFPNYPILFLDKNSSNSDNCLEEEDDSGHIRLNFSWWEIYEYPLRPRVNHIDDEIIDKYVDGVIGKMIKLGYNQKELAEEQNREKLIELVKNEIRYQLRADIDKMEIRACDRVNAMYPDLVLPATSIDPVSGKILDEYEYEISTRADEESDDEEDE